MFKEIAKFSIVLQMPPQNFFGLAPRFAGLADWALRRHAVDDFDRPAGSSSHPARHAQDVSLTGVVQLGTTPMRTRSYFGSIHRNRLWTFISAP
jgi:hypothetical protein